MLLSDRMKAVTDLVLPCESMADIGCDHGYVAIALIRNGICKRVIAMDINKGPLERAKGNIRDCKMQDSIETRLSDGAAALLPNEADGMICAGMGGRLVISILEQRRELVHKMKQLVLQPQSELNEVRSYLRQNGYRIEKEDMIFEDGKYYPMMRVSPMPETAGEECTETSERIVRVQDTYGPYLLEKSNPVLKQYLLWQKDNFENIMGNLKNTRSITARQQERIAELDEQLGDIVFCLYHYF